MNNFYLNKSTAFHLEIIKNYGNIVSSSDDDNWCNLILDVKNEYFTYNLNTEGITFKETKKIREILKKYLDDKLETEEEFETLEPYITISTKKTHGEWEVNIRLNLLLNGGFFGDYYNILLIDKNEVEKVYNAFNPIN